MSEKGKGKRGRSGGAGPADVGIACVLEAPGKLTFESRRAVRPAPNLVVARVVKAGICGTDLAIHGGEYAVPLPIVLGHEWVGVVEAVGPGVAPDLVGERVVCEINYTCRSRLAPDPCPACRRGFESHCLVRTVMGIVRANGCFASNVLVPAANLHRIPPQIRDDHAVFVEPLAAAIQTFELAPIYPGDRVVVLGSGRLGSLVLQVARLRGARVAAVARSAESRKRAKRLGAHAVFASGPELAAQVREFSDGLGADIVVEATGVPGGFGLALDLVRPRGTIALKTTCGQPSQIDVTRAVVNEVQISTSRCGPFGKALAMLRDGRLKIDPLIAGEFALSDLSKAFEAARGSGKILIRA